MFEYFDRRDYVERAHFFDRRRKRCWPDVEAKLLRPSTWAIPVLTAIGIPTPFLGGGEEMTIPASNVEEPACLPESVELIQQFAVPSDREIGKLRARRIAGVVLA
jgi:hypothetical protein